MASFRALLSFTATTDTNPKDGTAVLAPTPGARVHVNGVLIPAPKEMPGLGVSVVPPPGPEKVLVCQDSRVVFGRRHFFRLDISPPVRGASFHHVVLFWGRISCYTVPVPQR